MAKKTINVIYKVDDKELEEAKRTISGIEKEAKDADNAVKKFGNDANDAGKKASNSFSGLGKIIAGVSLVALAKQFYDFGKQVVNVTAEFQKFEAVLTNTLGSKSQAQIALAQIKQFAATTPFSVQELTSSFVKLANQGFVPTREEMRKLGDLSASTGKQFDMLTEAIIDAQTGEFERLKEFGIRASKEGDKVTFTFKGVQTQTEFTSQAIRDYVLSLGDAVGVSGSMAAISETLGGQISNMGDAWDTFMTTLGDGQKGPLKNVITNLQLLIQYATEFVESQDQARERLSLMGAASNLESFKALAESYGDVRKAAEDYLKILDLQADSAFRQQARAEDEKDMEAANLRAATIRQTTIAVQEYVKSLDDTQATKKTIAYGDAIKHTSIEAEKLKDDLEGVISEILRFEEMQNKLATSDENVMAVFDPEIIDQMDAVLEADARRRIQREQDVQNQILQVRQFAFDQSLNLIAQLLLAEDNRLQKAIEAEQFNSDQQILLAGDNERRKNEIRIESDRRIEELRKQQAEKEKEQTVKRILIESALNAVKALGTPPVPNFLLAGVTAGFGALQAGFVRSQGFKDGVIDLQGPGTTKSDSINARLSRGESVITAEATANSRNLLAAIQERKIDDRILDVAKSGGSQINHFDDSRIIKAIKDGKVDTRREAYTLYETKQIGSNLKRKIRSKIQGY